jgi:hypothetical protein
MRPSGLCTVVALAIATQGAAAVPLTAQAAPSPAGVAGNAGRSAILPGWGQWHQGQSRWWAYALAEAGLWAAHLELRASGRANRDHYRDVAWTSARVAAGERLEGPWAYYEAMSEWKRSGAFDADPKRPGVQPESDPTTFNGAKWALAEGIYFASGTAPSENDPAYEKAVAYYSERAYGTPYLWDWTGKDAALAEYNRLIDRSDQRFRQATAALGAVLANHLLSAVDAYVSARGAPVTGMRMTPESVPGGVRWTISARLVRRP